MQRKQKMWLLVGLTFLIIMAACQKEPGNEPPQPETAVSPTETIDLLNSDEQVSLVDESNASTDIAVDELVGIIDEPETAVIPEPVSDIVDDTIELDANGVQVGFTAAGFPYRGNPNASIVIEEFSDYQ